MKISVTKVANLRTVMQKIIDEAMLNPGKHSSLTVTFRQKEVPIRCIIEPFKGTTRAAWSYKEKGHANWTAATRGEIFRLVQIQFWPGIPTVKE